MNKQKSGLFERSVSLTTFVATIGIVLLVGFIMGTRSGELISTINRTFGTTFNSGQSINLDEAQQVYRMLKDHYDGELEPAVLSQGAARGLAAATGDQNTVYLDPKEAAEYRQSLEGKLSGIGAEIGVRNEQPTILRLLDDSPAQDSGLQPQDVVVQVDDTATIGFDATKTAQLIRGEAGTDVKLTVLRDNEPREFTITRAEVTDASVEGELRGDVGILKIRRFDMDTGEQARTVANRLIVQGAKRFVLDMRDNPGGYLNQAQSVAGMWIEDQLVVSEKRAGVQVGQLSSTGAQTLGDIPTVALINEGSASASEIVAGALQDYDIAPVIGETSFGKGTVQRIFQLSGEAGEVKITIARWFTPNGTSIEETGVVPDQKVELTSEDLDGGRDPQLEAALKALD